MSDKRIKSALISVFHKEGLDPIINHLAGLGITMYSTGGTEKHIRSLGAEVVPVEQLTDYPSIFGGRVKTLHPKVFGGILHRREDQRDKEEAKRYDIPAIDLVIVDLYPFQETVASGASEEDIIEKIDIGGIALIRGAAKNFNDVLIVSSRAYYGDLLEILQEREGVTSLKERKLFATRAFATSSEYDASIFTWMNNEQQVGQLSLTAGPANTLRYGENPHQKGIFYGDLKEYFEQIHGKEISYNNLVDIEAAVQLIAEFSEATAFAILKHNNACGVALADTVLQAYQRAFAADTVSAFGGVLVTNQQVDQLAAEEINGLFFEILIAPTFSDSALEVLKSKKNRILLIQKKSWHQEFQYKSLLNGVLAQDYDLKSESSSDLEVKTNKKPSSEEIEDLLFAAKVCKQSKSNTIVLARENQLLASGVGQTSRVDALNQAIEKAGKFGFSLDGAVMASDAFFPFPDCVEIAHKAGISAVIQPGGSIKDQDSIDYCNKHDLSMVMTGVRHFKH
ncbi:MAG: bifunctional phosphoribosylaminoimidazolecarboxamide formyltransferase/IMP cyclohydrolase [Bacteroidota bacterium]